MGLLNRQAVRRLTLAIDRERRRNTPQYQATRVSPEFLDRLEADVAAMVRERVRSRPSRGKTIQ